MPGKRTDGIEMTRTYRIGGHETRPPPLEPALYLVSTPIGNLSDITLRALETLAAADILACEDTRVTRKLLARYGIASKPVAYHEHNADRAGPALIESLKDGKSVALVSDAGTPLISDPGFRLVEMASAEVLTIVPVPGASAPLAALVASGLPNDSFFFGGFVPARDKARRDRLSALSNLPATLLLFESPHRIKQTLEASADIFGSDRPAAVCRELTKLHEEVQRGSLGELVEIFAQRTGIKGEIVLAIAPGQDEPVDDADAEVLLRELSTSMSPGKAATEAARQTGLPRKDLYQRILALKSETS